MLTLQLPMLLALLGTALMAVVIFAPSRLPAPVTASFAPPALERWDPPPAEQWAPEAFETWEPAIVDPPLAKAPAWPAAIDPRAAGCDATARLGLVDALAAVGTPWSEAILRRALHDEPDPVVRDAVSAALAAYEARTSTRGTLMA